MADESKETSTTEHKPSIESSEQAPKVEQGQATHSEPSIIPASSPQSADTTGQPAPTSAEATAPVDESTPRLREAPVDPRVASLRALFPDFDDGLLQSVLESVGGNQDRAIDTLLGMSDPDYKGEAQPHQPMSQSDLDEELARRLYMEDQQQVAWQAQNQQFQHPGWQEQVPIGHPSPPAAEKDTMAELGEQFNKFAETGKKTLGNLFTKVKAKISEFEQGRSTSQTTLTGPDTNTYQYAGQQPHPAHPQQPPYFDPNVQGATPPSGGATPVRGYDTTPNPSIEQSSAGDAPRPPPTSSGPVDTGKIGLLPKKPVSLLQNQTPAKETTTRSNDNDDELEYLENPFEEGKK